jgi:hypothetical protein
MQVYSIQTSSSVVICNIHILSRVWTMHCSTASEQRCNRSSRRSNRKAVALRRLLPRSMSSVIELGWCLHTITPQTAGADCIVLYWSWQIVPKLKVVCRMSYAVQSWHKQCATIFYKSDLPKRMHTHQMYSGWRWCDRLIVSQTILQTKTNRTVPSRKERIHFRTHRERDITRDTDDIGA